MTLNAQWQIAAWMPRSGSGQTITLASTKASVAVSSHQRYFATITSGTGIAYFAHSSANATLTSADWAIRPDTPTLLVPNAGTTKLWNISNVSGTTIHVAAVDGGWR